MIYVVFEDRSHFEAFKAAHPCSLVSPFTKIGEPATEYDDGTGRCIVAHNFTPTECLALQQAGADVRVSDPDGLEYGSQASFANSIPWTP